eukprot:5407641-Pleurochrysis_carterae.AAC.5
MFVAIFRLPAIEDRLRLACAPLQEFISGKKKVSLAISVPHQPIRCDGCCAAGRANTALPPSPALLVVARRLRSTWRSRPHPPSIFIYIDNIRSFTSL